MKKIFSFLMLLSLLAVACEKESNNTEYQSVLKPEKTTVKFGKDGGSETISFTIQTSLGGSVTATENADWIEAVVDFNKDLIITVSANSGAEREDVVMLNYEYAKSVAITVKQNSADSPDFDVEFVANRFEGVYDGANNYFIILSNCGAKPGGAPRPNGTYYFLDMYGSVAGNSEYPVLPNGEYRYDTDNSHASLTISEEGSWYGLMDSAGEYAVPMNFKEVTATVNNGKFEAIIELTSGELHRVTFEGELVAFIDYYRSTFYEDVEFAVEDATITASLYGDSYEVGQQNWFVEAKKGNEVFMIEVFNSSTEKCDGLYTMLNPDNPNYADTYIPGMVNEGLIGTWYATVSNGKITGDAWAPMHEGAIRLSTSGNTLTIEYGCNDDWGNNITGSVSGKFTVKDLRE